MRKEIAALRKSFDISRDLDNGERIYEGGYSPPRKPRKSCYAVHARSEQTPDGRWWCWSPSESPQDSNPVRVEELLDLIDQTAVRWRDEMARQFKLRRGE